MVSLYKIVCLGDSYTGKTALVKQDYEATIEDTYRKLVVVDYEPCVLEVLDTVGIVEEYAPLRDEWIRDGEGFVLTYSISSRITFEKIERLHDQITRVKDTHKVHIVLAGTNCDKFTEREVSQEEGMNMARRLKCEFIEVSAKTCVNVETML
ncbi:17463_t:CDS:2 [Cetraspora pellucida]|uniref:17463_t:CDS:1 n=1 Tax=Cetraspora pellucida TaxID=1433469 RepID=A0A9N9CNG4_9GLOM|nr:17463_t:CDS:2 [Cetraspora pellucida]